MIDVATWINLENTTLNEQSKSQKTTYWVILLYEVPEWVYL